MAISSTNNRISYSGNGVTTAFAFPYKFLTDADLVVISRVTATGVETVKTLTTDYTVTGEGLDAGGTVTMVVAPASGTQLIIYRDVAATQELDYRENDSFPAESTESGFDKLTMITQRLKDVSERAVTLSEGYTAAFDTTLPPVLTAGSSLIINADGDGFDVGPTVVSIDEHNIDTTDVHGIADTSILVTTTGSQTLTNKTIDGDDNTVQDLPLTALKTVGGDASKFLARDGSGVPVSVNTVPAGTVVGTTDTQTLTNKTLTSPTLTTPSIDVATLDGQASTPSSPSSGFYKAYVKDSTQKLTILNSAGVETTVGSGGTGQNFITNGDAEAGTTGWAVYADAAGSSPVDGTGGSANVTITASSTDPLSGNQSFILTKDAANRQGQGFSYDFTIDNAAKFRAMTLKFDYICGSGFTAGSSTVDSDITVWIYDVTNATVIQPSNFRLFSNSVTVPDQFQAEFQTTSSTSYRLILHVATTSAVAWSVKADSVIVSPSEYVFGTPISDWQSYTPTVSAGFGSATNISAKYRRIGDSIEIIGSHTNGTVAGSLASISLPSGLSIDSNKLTINNTSSNPGNNVGFWSASNNAGQLGNVVTAPSTSGTLIYFGGNNSVAAKLTPQNGSAIVDSSVVFAYHLKVPISGQSSSVQMSDQTSTRIVAFQAYKNGGSVTANTTVTSWTSVQKDTHASFNASTGVYTVPVAGDYQVGASIGTTTSTGIHNIYLNGTAIIRSGSSGQASSFGIIPNCKVGDTITLALEGSLTLVSQNVNTFTISRISGPSQIASSETVAASYYISSDFAASTTTPINFDTKEYDTHNAVTTSPTAWKFTAPIAGLYQLSGFIDNGSGGAYALIYKNGTAYKTVGWDNATTAGAMAGSIMLDAGDYIDIRPNASVTVNGGALSGGDTGIISITRVGNRG